LVGVRATVYWDGFGIIQSAYRRYAIADEAMLREGAEKLAALHASVSETPGKVVVLRDTRA
jgi:hypothetical protein